MPNFGLQRTGLLSMLDVECSIRGTAESYIAKVKVQHKQNPRLFEPKTLEPRTFGIQHFAGRVVYDASDFLGKQIPSSFYITEFKPCPQQMWSWGSSVGMVMGYRLEAKKSGFDSWQRQESFLLPIAPRLVLRPLPIQGLQRLFFQG